MVLSVKRVVWLGGREIRYTFAPARNQIRALKLRPLDAPQASYVALKKALRNDL